MVRVSVVHFDYVQVNMVAHGQDVVALVVFQDVILGVEFVHDALIFQVAVLLHDVVVGLVVDDFHVVVMVVVGVVVALVVVLVVVLVAVGFEVVVDIVVWKSYY